MMVVTDHFLVYTDAHGPQRVPLVAILKVSADHAGRLTIDAQPLGSIQGDVRGFDMTELMAFFEHLKREIARAKQDAVVETTKFPQQQPVLEVPRPSHPVSPRVSAGWYVILGVLVLALIGLWLFMAGP
jgi:hypothetical protein